MKFANWSLVYANDPNNEALDKAEENMISNIISCYAKFRLI